METRPTMARLLLALVWWKNRDRVKKKGHSSRPNPIPLVRVTEAIITFLLIDGWTASKAAVVAVSLETLTVNADHIVVGTVVSGTDIESGVVVLSELNLKGQATGSQHLVASNLGRYEAQFAIGERVLLFLKTSGVNFQVLFGAQGKFTIKNGLVLETGGAESQLIDSIRALLP